MNPDTHLLLLDVDGVLIELPDFFCSRFPSAPVRAFFADGFQSASTGKSSVLEHLPKLMAEVGREGSPEEFYREWLDYENRPDKDMVAAAAELKAAGWRIYLATNQEELRVQHLMSESGLSAVTDGHFASYSVGYRKPSQEYYGAVTQALGVSPEQIIFWDDSVENVDAARAAGWSSHLFTNVADFRRVMGLQRS
ncbi:HAD-IA family hydrolase [Deinococcus lacus]|uniref:HAD-IA family hydrolase n=1 Tax=Deinococcus lacus TaxID=392561 RepID=A0ABW1YGK2_9DEIO